jgi:hypothetical protein
VVVSPHSLPRKPENRLLRLLQKAGSASILNPRAVEKRPKGRCLANICRSTPVERREPPAVARGKGARQGLKQRDVWLSRERDGVARGKGARQGLKLGSGLRRERDVPGR